MQQDQKQKQLVNNMFKSKFADPSPEDDTLNYLAGIDKKYANAKIIFQDEQCIAFQETPNPVAKVHFIVTPKREEKD